VSQQFDDGTAPDRRRSHRFDGRVMLGQQRLTIADESANVPVAADLTCSGVVNHTLSGPHRL
jgi:hypothetical protein